MKYKYSPPFLLQKIFSDFIWKTSNKKILLTFDDGPTKEATIKILSILKSNRIKALFFCVGNNLRMHPQLTKKIIEEGHVIGNHTMNHKRLTQMSREESIEEISSLNKLMNEKFNYDLRYFRPPYGTFNLRTNRILRELNLKCVMWNLLTYDFENDFEKVKYSIDNYLQNNSVIVFHDSIKCSSIIEASLNYTIEKASKNSYEFGEPEDCLK